MVEWRWLIAGWAHAITWWIETSDELVFAHLLVEWWWLVSWRTQTHDEVVLFCTHYGRMVAYCGMRCYMKNSDFWWILIFFCSQWILCELLVQKFLVQDNNISEAAAAASLQAQIWLGLWNAAVVFHSLKIGQFVCLLFVVCRFIKIWQSRCHTTYTQDITHTSLEINSTASVVWSLL